MRTITFYSYKGGVGRSLLVANAAKYLATLGKRVFALDFDLEAPGLHYKFQLGSTSKHEYATPGIVDILEFFQRRHRLPSSLSEFTTELESENGAEKIRLMGAGRAPLGDYWRTLSQINWHNLFYSNRALGTPLFLELRERIRRDFNPDFCLIDSRTGITEMGGVATTLLPDTVVCLGLDSREHLDGLRAAMQGIKQSASALGTEVTIVPVISRLLNRRDDSIEHQELERIRNFLRRPVTDTVEDFDLDEVIALHSEPLLELEEQLLVGGKNSPHELRLLRDYLKLFSKIIPAEDLRPHVGQLIQRATSRLLEDPDAAQSDLEALTTYCADEEAYRALLKLYQLRKASLDKIVATAAVMWQLRVSKSVADQLLQDIVRAAFSDTRATDIQKKYADFADDVWRSSGMQDAKIGIAIANAFLPEQEDRAIRLLSDYVDKLDSPASTMIVKLLDLLRRRHSYEIAASVVERFKATATDPAFHAAWASLVVDQASVIEAQSILQDPSFRAGALRTDHPATLYRLLKIGEHPGAARVLQDALEIALAAEDFSALLRLGEVYKEEGRLREFEGSLRTKVAPGVFEDLMAHFRKVRPGRFMTR